MLAIAILAPFLGTVDPTRIDPAARNKKPGTEITFKLEDGNTFKRTVLMGTDSLGRDVYSRVIYGTRVSLAIGVAVALIAVAIGLVIGLVSGYVRWPDGIIMRIMDGLMAIPGILLAIALVSIWRAGLITVIFAIVVPDVPRVVRLVRSIVLTVREEPYVEGAISVGTPTWTLMFRHILPNTVAPLIVQGTFIAAAAILAEAVCPSSASASRRRSRAGATSWPRAARCSACSRTTSSIPASSSPSPCWRSTSWATGCATRSIPR